MAISVVHATIPIAPAQVGATEWAESHTVTGALTLADVYPVGSVYISVLSTSPATLFGFGTWSAIGAGRVLVGLDSNDTDFDALEETGGAKTASAAGSLSGIAVSDHAAHTHSVTSNVTVADHAAHTHTYTDVVNHVHTNAAFTDVASATTGAATTHYQTLAKTTDTSSTASDFVPPNTGNPTGGVATGTTANPNATLTHTPTNNAVTSGNPSATLTHTVSSQGTFTGSATSIVQSYLVVKMWKRTA